MPAALGFLGGNLVSYGAVRALAAVTARPVWPWGHLAVLGRAGAVLPGGGPPYCQPPGGRRPALGAGGTGPMLVGAGILMALPDPLECCGH